MPERPERQPAPILVVALSGRSLAASARRAGWAPVVLDAFADLDTRGAATAAEKLPVDRDWRLDGARLLEAAGRLAPPPVPLAYGSGLERNLDLLESLAAGRELLGMSPAAAGRAKDPFAFAALLWELGVPHPEVRREPPPVADEGLADQARRRCRRGACATRRRAAGARRYYQRRAPGRPVSVLVAGDGAGRRQPRLLSEQWPDPTPERHVPLRRRRDAGVPDGPAGGSARRDRGPVARRPAYAASAASTRSSTTQRQQSWS
jgi:hypothetical protein